MVKKLGDIGKGEGKGGLLLQSYRKLDAATTKVFHVVQAIPKTIAKHCELNLQLSAYNKVCV